MSLATTFRGQPKQPRMPLKALDDRFPGILEMFMGVPAPTHEQITRSVSTTHANDMIQASFEFQL